jgi:hypothetical protein
MMTSTQAAVIGDAQSRWCPSKYGADDEAGALNEITPGKVLEAARDHVHEFLLVISHAKLRGATGAWVAPLAIV